MIVVVADDITGAAEIAGVGLRFGMRVALALESKGRLPDADLLVCALDTRSMPQQKAVDQTARVVRLLKNVGCNNVFKKTDSALRGHIVSELETLLHGFGLKRAICIPENPSKGRIIRDGIYYIDGVPLERTVFADDPEFPAFTADVRKRLPGITGIISPGTDMGEGIFIGNAETEADIDAYFLSKDDSTLFAGGADLFAAYLRNAGWKEILKSPEFEGLGTKDAIVICGSTVQHSLAEQDYFKRKNVPFVIMPDKVFELKIPPKAWFTDLSEVYELHHSIALSVGHPARKNPKFALRLKNIMALAAAALVDTHLPDELLIEGGATAFAVLKALGWSRFLITDEIAPGVVRMTLDMNLEELSIWNAKSVHITLKPGSYPWGSQIFQ